MYFMSLLLLSTLCTSAPAAAPLSISFAEQPVRLLRDKGFYTAGRGTQLKTGDIVESGSAALQIDGGGASTVALGPASRLHVRSGTKGNDYLLLSGWLKAQARTANESSPTAVGAAGIRLDATGASVILHASGGKTELFVESGEARVDELKGLKVLRRTAVLREQYAVRTATQPLKVAPRAPKEFLGGMPPAFFDALVPVAAKGTVSAPRLERRAAFEDIAPWLVDQPELHQAIYRRFHPPRPALATPARRLNPPIAKDPT